MKSTDIIEPGAMSQPVAAQGSRNEIPQNATGSNLASVAEGFPDITMISPTDGGLPPYGQDFNGLFYLTTCQWVYLQNGGFITFNQNVSDAIGGYPKGAILGYISSDNMLYNVRSLIDDNTYNFVETPDYINDEYWEELPPETEVEWGSITGDITNQTDLQNELTDLQTNIDTLQITVETDYLSLSGGTLTGAVYGVTPSSGDSSTQLATTEFVQNETNPDYKSRVSISSGYTCSANGYINIYTLLFPNATATSFDLYINSISVKFVARGNNAAFSERYGGDIYRVSLGDVITVSASNISEYSLYFIPMKGA
ncbi:MAG: hypothetical protein LUE98_21200 [Tannerellaceae bacterium]|nr:hypothetical protein [Tannerellaceae bacterium]